MDSLLEGFGKLSASEKSQFVSAARILLDSTEGGAPAVIRAYDEHVEAHLKPFLAICNKLGDDCAAISAVVEKAWAQQREIIATAANCREPDQQGMRELFAGVGTTMKEINSAVKRNAMENNIKTIFEGAQGLNWMLVKPAPVDFMTSYIDGSDMWSNRIRREFKGVNDDQITFCVLFKTLMNELRAYVKEYHRTGLSWNAKGVSVAEYSGSAPATTSQTLVASSVGTSSAGGASAGGPDVVNKSGLFSELNAGGSVTAGLKKVTKDQQTWRAEYKGEKEAPLPVTAPKPKPATASTIATGAPKCELKGDKWVLDFLTAAQSPVTVVATDIKQTVYIYKCDGATVVVEGKCKSIIVDSSRRVNLTFADLVAGLEVVNSKNTTVTCISKVPSVAIDKCDGVLVVIPATALGVEVTASKSSEMNLSFPDPDNPGEMLERPIPEQYVHTIDKKSITARVSDLYSH